MTNRFTIARFTMETFQDRDTAARFCDSIAFLQGECAGEYAAAAEMLREQDRCQETATYEEFPY
jgi:hypothetical protein